MTYLYIMTFGSFIGFSGAFPKLILDVISNATLSPPRPFVLRLPAESALPAAVWLRSRPELLRRQLAAARNPRSEPRLRVRAYREPGRAEPLQLRVARAVPWFNLAHFWWLVVGSVERQQGDGGVHDHLDHQHLPLRLFLPPHHIMSRH